MHRVVLSFFSSLLPLTHGRKYLGERKTRVHASQQQPSALGARARARAGRLYDSRVCSHILPISCSTFPARAVGRVRTLPIRRRSEETIRDRDQKGKLGPRPRRRERERCTLAIPGKRKQKARDDRNI